MFTLSPFHVCFISVVGRCLTWAEDAVTDEFNPFTHLLYLLLLRTLIMSTRLENVELQLSEVEMLQSMFPGKDEVVFDDEVVIDQMKNYLGNDGDDPNKTLKFTLKYELKDAISCILRVEFMLPVNYPSEENISVQVRCQKMSKLQYKDINEEMKKLIDEIGVGDLCIFQIIEWLNENTENYITRESNQSKEAGVETNQSDNVCQQFSRYWIYSHHIYSKTKRKNILEWSKELQLTGFSMPGKPGIVCVEGPMNNCEEFWQRMKRQTWKRLSLAHKEDGVLSIDSASSSFQRKFPDVVAEKDFGVHGGRDYHMDLGQFAAFLKKHDSHEIFSLLFGVEGKEKT
ncbi:RWD domain-containing protein 2B-like isoform X1 [Styela clava]